MSYAVTDFLFNLASVRDVILPGQMTDPLTKVTEAKKAAEANLSEISFPFGNAVVHNQAAILSLSDNRR